MHTGLPVQPEGPSLIPTQLAPGHGRATAAGLTSPEPCLTVVHLKQQKGSPAPPQLCFSKGPNLSPELQLQGSLGNASADAVGGSWPGEC